MKSLVQFGLPLLCGKLEPNLEGNSSHVQCKEVTNPDLINY
jgi:hypothetical protein